VNSDASGAAFGAIFSVLQALSIQELLANISIGQKTDLIGKKAVF
jgi:hypothetical protein